MTGAITTTFCKSEREAITRAVLNAPAEQSHKLLSDQVGISAEAVRRIRYGLMYASHCPELDRLEFNSRGAARSCTQCVHWVPEVRRLESDDGRDLRSLGRCGLGIPEAEDVRHGRRCGAWAEAANQHHRP